MAYRILNTVTVAILVSGLWKHDWTTIAASVGLLVMWWLIHEEVVEASQ